jgi:hypothetical protein
MPQTSAFYRVHCFRQLRLSFIEISRIAEFPIKLKWQYL